MLLDVYPRDTKAHVPLRASPRKSATAVFLAAPDPLSCARLHKLWSTHTHPPRTLVSREKERSVGAHVTWVRLQRTTGNEKSQSRKVAYRTIPCIEHSRNEKMPGGRAAEWVSGMGERRVWL